MACCGFAISILRLGLAPSAMPFVVRTAHFILFNLALPRQRHLFATYLPDGLVLTTDGGAFPYLDLSDSHTSSLVHHKK